MDSSIPALCVETGAACRRFQFLERVVCAVPKTAELRSSISGCLVWSIIRASSVIVFLPAPVLRCGVPLSSSAFDLRENMLHRRFGGSTFVHRCACVYVYNMLVYVCVSTDAIIVIVNSSSASVHSAECHSNSRSSIRKEVIADNSDEAIVSFAVKCRLSKKLP
jgi:hypothetical protein